jgi:hypothetical protein
MLFAWALLVWSSWLSLWCGILKSRTTAIAVNNFLHIGTAKPYSAIVQNQSMWEKFL